MTLKEAMDSAILKCPECHSKYVKCLWTIKDNSLWECKECGEKFSYGLPKEEKPKEERYYYSNCCSAIIPDYPDSDVCPACGEHCCGLNEEEMENESEKPYDLIKSVDQMIIQLNRIKKASDDLLIDSLNTLAKAEKIKADLIEKTCTDYMKGVNDGR